MAALLCWGQGCGAKKPAEPAKATKVLFVGDSLTYVNDLPRMFSDLARSRGDLVEVDLTAKGGNSLRDHLNSAWFHTKLQAKPWDFVVLQEQSQIPAFPPDEVAQRMTPAALELNRLIHAHRPETATVFFESWGLKNGDDMNCGHFPELCSYGGMQSRIEHTYEELTERTGALLAPVGRAWAAVRQAHPEIELYKADGIHPELPGSYLAACVFYATLFKKSAAGADALGLDPAQAETLQSAADEAVFGASGPK